MPCRKIVTVQVRGEVFHKSLIVQAEFIWLITAATFISANLLLHFSVSENESKMPTFPSPSRSNFISAARLYRGDEDVVVLYSTISTSLTVFVSPSLTLPRTRESI